MSASLGLKLPIVMSVVMETATVHIVNDKRYQDTIFTKCKVNRVNVTGR